MFVEVRAVGGRKKHYLVHSFRQGKKVKKLRRYLGSDLSKEKLEQIKKIAEQQLLHRIKV